MCSISPQDYSAEDVTIVVASVVKLQLNLTVELEIHANQDVRCCPVLLVGVRRPGIKAHLYDLPVNSFAALDRRGRELNCFD